MYVINCPEVHPSMGVKHLVGAHVRERAKECTWMLFGLMAYAYTALLNYGIICSNPLPRGSMYGIFTYMNGEKWPHEQGEMGNG